MKKRLLLYSLSLASAVAALVIFQYLHFHDGKLHMIVCDVGQGDAILLIFPSGRHILVDGGPDRSVLQCLSRHLPFWDRTIDLVLLTHPHADHFFGLFFVLDQYHVKSFATEDVINKTREYKELIALLGKKRVPQKKVFAGDRWQIGKVIMEIVGPTQEYVRESSPGGSIGESKELASLMTLVSYGSFTVLLTGDSQTKEMQSALSVLPDQLSVLQSPHHGSKTGLDASIVQALSPDVAVISVGLDNTYGHPNQQILDIFRDAEVRVRRTDKEGDVEFAFSL
jgi:competence protein ComEC